MSKHSRPCSQTIPASSCSVYGRSHVLSGRLLNASESLPGSVVAKMMITLRKSYFRKSAPLKRISCSFKRSCAIRRARLLFPTPAGPTRSLSVNRSPRLCWMFEHRSHQAESSPRAVQSPKQLRQLRHHPGLFSTKDTASYLQVPHVQSILPAGLIVLPGFPFPAIVNSCQTSSGTRTLPNNAFTKSRCPIIARFMRGEELLITLL